MPVISRFYGITIKMYFKQREHNPPHLHAIYDECIGLFDLVDGEMFEGDLSPKEQRIIRKFIKRYKTQLMEMWETQIFRELPPVE